MQTRLIAIIIIQFLAAVLAQKTNAQLRLVFSDSLESRAEVNKISFTEGFGDRYATLKIGKAAAIKNFSKQVNRDTLDFEQALVRAPLLQSLLSSDRALFGKAIATKATFEVLETIKYELIGLNIKTNVTAIHATTENINESQRQNSVLSSNSFGTSFIKAEIGVGENRAILEATIIGENEIIGVSLFESDTVLIRRIDKAKKYNAVGVELVTKGRVFAGIQLPDMHIGPSYVVVDKAISPERREFSIAVLSILLYINENRSDFK
jgi:hypothetical protein